ncbi:MAG: hypothetical protein QOI95_2921 [Acidimicrobiaceae bacterium]|jgi:integrase/recombinase XerD
MHTTHPPTLSYARDLYGAWLENSRDLSPHTVRAYTTDVSALVDALGPSTALSTLDARAVRSFLELQRSSGLRSSSVRRRAAGIRGFCGFLKRETLTTDDPWPAERLEFHRSRHLPRAVPADELGKLLSYLWCQVSIGDDSHDRPPITNPHGATTLLGCGLMLGTGMRVGELVSLRTHDVDLGSRQIRVLGKGRRERIVYLSDDWLTGMADSYLATRPHLGVSHDQFLFGRSLAPLTASSMRDRLAQAAQIAGVRHITPHMLRHSAATQLVESGVNIRLIQRLLGHASLTTTEIYTHVTDEALRQAVASAGVVSRCLERR